MALRQLFRETTTESSRMQEVVVWLFREIKTEAKRKQLHQDLAEATVTHLPCPSRVEVLRVLREHGFSGSLEETLDHSVVDYLFTQALTVSDEQKEALQINVGNVWEHGDVQDLLRSAATLSSPTGGAPVGGSTAGDVGAVTRAFHECSGVVTRLLRTQEDQDQQYKDLMLAEQNGAQANSTRAASPSGPDNKTEGANSELYQLLKQCKTLGVEIPKFDEESVRSQGIGPQLSALLGFCCSDPITWNSPAK